MQMVNYYGYAKNESRIEGKGRQRCASIRIHGMDFDNGLRLLATDADLVEMIAQMPPSRAIEVYLENVPVMDCWDNQVESCDVSGSSQPREVISQIESDHIGELIADNVDVSVDKSHDVQVENDGDDSDVENDSEDVDFYDSDYAMSEDDLLF
ncbi:uncharacterized protein LOC114299635 isoform X2 [Camellia sinensis]|uniref:uncharacterized protein LOC114299635 isoform X2 n=2 Tax=Camellia sinensis TaxID=4442 RepID=UPI001036C0DC|nr:uncharacterized protein LOC114299635 isoform X2 [Camellia sinensis]XP_028100220.1 uncharacterized protein LOC114299635 isoform X2 [Camellia sinensis]